MGLRWSPPIETQKGEALILSGTSWSGSSLVVVPRLKDREEHGARPPRSGGMCLGAETLTAGRNEPGRSSAVLRPESLGVEARPARPARRPAT